MKRIISILFMIMCVFSMNAQSITKDVQNGELRTVQTSFETYSVTKGLFKGKFDISLMAFCEPNDTSYYLVPEITLTSPKTIVKNSKMILKVDDKIITAVCPFGVGAADYQYKIIGTETFYYIYPAYMISKEDIETVINGKCTKIRIECNWGNGHFDVGLDINNIKKFYLSDTLEELYNLIQGRIKIENNIYDNF